MTTAKPPSKKASTALSPSMEKLIAKAMQMHAEDSPNVGYMARALVQASLPYRPVAGSEWTRRNGNFKLTLLAPSDVGIPYGVMPRLLLTWLSTEAVRTKSRRIELGSGLTAFMRELGLQATGGKWGSITRFKKQALSLFSCTMSFSYTTDDGKGQGILNRTVADEVVLWQADVRGLQSHITLSEPFYQEIIAHAVPLDMVALRALRGSAMALDIYSWLTYRMSYLKSASEISWTSLENQFGAGYARTRAFREAFIHELKKVQAVYPKAQVEATPHALIVFPAPTHVRRKPKL